MFPEFFIFAYLSSINSLNMKTLLQSVWRIMLVIVPMSLSSCDILDYLLQDITESELTLNTETQVAVDPEGQYVKIGFTSTLPWTVEFDYSTSDAWITSSETSGQEGEIVLNLKAKANETGEERTATMTIFAGDIYARVTFTQASIQSDAESFFKILSEDAVVGHEGGLVEVLVSTNTEYSFTAPYDWLREINVEGTMNITHVFEVDPNTDTQERVAYIAFCSDLYCYSYTITQEGAPEEEVSGTEDINKGDDINIR